MPCKYCKYDKMYHTQEDMDELEYRSSKPEKTPTCTIIPKRPSVLKADEISIYCNDYEGYRQCNKKIND
jgi:hypothetical protein